MVAILNAETLRNPHTKQRQQLAALVAHHSASEAEYFTNAFLQPDTQRETEVEVVLIHLEKIADFKADFLDGLAKDAAAAAKPEDFGSHTELMLPANWIANQVAALKLATTALREAAIADVRAAYYAGMLGRSLADTSEDAAGNPEATAAEKINAGYIKLMESAWTSVLRSADVTTRLSSAAQKRLESDFQQICQLEFTVQNVYGFLGGLLAKQNEIQIEMLCDVFDEFSKHHDDNRVYYQGWRGQGWKSNTKHRTCGMSVKASRIVLPARRRDWYADSYRDLAWDDVQRFRDFDKVFAMMDGGKNTDAIYGLEKMFQHEMKALCSGQRCRSTYFDARFYPKSGTFHLFPTQKQLIDRLNRLVGQQRAWLPPDDSAVAPGFWQQFSEAERVNKATDFGQVNAWRLNSGSDYEREQAAASLTIALQAATAKVGIEYDPDYLLPNATADVPQLPLLRAA